MTISGSNLENPQSVEIANVACENILVSEALDSITCDLAGLLPAGSWLPSVVLEEGKVKVDEAVSALTIDLVVTSISPKLNLNPAGGDIITIVGSGFPESLDGRFELSILLGPSTRCVIFEISFTQMKCETEPFTTNRRRMLQDTSFGMNIHLTSDTSSIDYTESGLELNANPITATGITPSSVSPIALRTIVVQLNPDYPEADMTKDDFTVTIVPESLEITYLTVNNEGVR